MNLEIEQTYDGDSVVLTFVGILDQRALPAAVEQLEAAAGQHPGGVILDLYECEYLDQEAINWIGDVRAQMRDEGRQFELYVRPMSFVAHRTRNSPQAIKAPMHVVERGESRLAERRAARLEKWRVERPIPHETGATPEPVQAPAGGGYGSEPEDEDLVPLDFAKVAALSGKDERVVRDVWRTYSQLLREGQLDQTVEGGAPAQMAADAKRVAFELRLDPKVVRQVIEAVSTHLVEVFGVEEA